MSNAQGKSPSLATRKVSRGVIGKLKEQGAVDSAIKQKKIPVKAAGFRNYLRRATLAERIKLEREGVPSEVVSDLITVIGVSTNNFQRYAGIPKATFTLRMRDKLLFSGTQGQSVVGILDLINQVEDMLAADPDNPDAKNFDVERWVGEWIERPQPALGGLAPAEVMDTPTGRASVMRVLGAIQSGAYQ
ncbi:DUF2384 domain-containing protein [Pseudoxanthomonas sp. LjRoot143]|jgi:uncharacterized protein (DUF2384 family)|uniref:antitoxin Xre/MbcA/ParS toxin-binding domain-containing protein n=1 Tax=unclassified Pseudoxanthomonas TaxID=2645906 RepID=UPI0009D76A19|nr:MULTISPECIES: antitoxin Xre/MbcA/ParS toxin-binding domain-containing protein [unclassified Pseudoxanthomonas]PZQ34327.1 MAG: DUF2384 domain-containing protein [Stenotrophomonas acidaminiphila]HEV7270615.1 antitoxin Xre/MbcA/ParS toxin-binding domain-containing protein [Pseudoxanthomonas sp.]